jgi:hypothetical protein
MITTEARIQTPLASRYLTQLCKHFEHKLPVTHGNGAGSIAFSSGVCTLAADAETLSLNATAADDASLAQLTDVVGRHLIRFAFREPLSIEWGAATP